MPLAMLSSVSICTYDSISASRSRSHFARAKNRGKLMSFSPELALGCGLSLEPPDPNAWFPQLVVCDRPESAGSILLFDCFPKSPRKMRSSHDLQVDAKRDIGTRVQSGGLPPNRARWHARWYDRGPGQGLTSEGLTYREFPGASHFEGGIRALACLAVYSTR